MKMLLSGENCWRYVIWSSQQCHLTNLANLTSHKPDGETEFSKGRSQITFVKLTLSTSSFQFCSFERGHCLLSLDFRLLELSLASVQTNVVENVMFVHSASHLRRGTGCNAIQKSTFRCEPQLWSPCLRNACYFQVITTSRRHGDMKEK